MAKTTGATKLLCVIGDPISHSLSPLIHSIFIESCGLDLAYMAFRVTGESLESFFSASRLLGVKGFNVTMPLKQKALLLCDEADELAQGIGAANTIEANGEGRYIAHNTDGEGVVKSLKGLGASLSGKTAVILGAGGAAKAAAFALKREGAITYMGTRHEWMISKPLSEGISFFMFDSLDTYANKADIIINATPLGMKGGESFPGFGFLSSAKEGAIVFDMVYSPIKTKLLIEAGNMGLRTVNGLDLLLNQAVSSFKFFTGIEPGESAAAKARQALSEISGESKL